MSRIKKIDRILLNHNYLDNPIEDGSGVFGVCYYYNDYLVLKKMLNKEHIKENIKEIEANAKKLCGIESKTYVFPKTLIYDKKSFYGYIMDLVNGRKLARDDDKILLKDLVESLDLAYEETYKISKKGITTEDVFSRNMILDENNNLRIIDTDFYERKPVIDVNTTFNNNLTSLNSGILVYLMGLDRIQYLARYYEFEKFAKLFNLDLKKFIQTIEVKNLLSEIDKWASDEKGDFCTIKDADHYIRERYRKLM